MKRFVLILPSILSLGFICAADQEKSASAVQISQVIQAPLSVEPKKPDIKPDILSFESNVFFDKTSSEIVDNFINSINKDAPNFKLTPDDWKQIGESRSTLFPCITLQESSSKIRKGTIGNLKSKARTLFDHDGTTTTRYEHTYNNKSDFHTKINSVVAHINDQGEVALNVVIPSGTIKESKDKFLPDFSKAGRKITALYLDPNSCDVWMGLEKGGIYRYKILSNQHESYSDKLQDQDIKALGFAGNGKLLVSVTKKQILFTDIHSKIARFRILPEESWTKAYLTNNHVILSKKWCGVTYNTYYTLPINYGLGVGFTSPNELAYLWFLNQLRKGLSLELSQKIIPQIISQSNENDIGPSISKQDEVLKASLLVNAFLRKPENIRPYDRSISRAFRAFLKENESYLQTTLQKK